jgi:protocatechuate 3,4-dioxygenase beta subunit
MNAIKKLRNGLSIELEIPFSMVKVAVGIACFAALSIFPDEGHCQDQSATVTIVTKDEPGKKLIVEGRVLLPDGSPAPGARIWVFQTDAKGYYKKSESGGDLGWREARISKVFTAGPNGEFQIHTIRPGGYPGRASPEHIHFRISTSEIEEQEHTIFFADDERVTDSFKSRIQRDDRLYLVDLKTDDDYLVGKFNLVFDL